jgi:hypothetical protein
MNQPLDETRSAELCQQIKAKAATPFDNAYRAAIATPGSTYVQGFVVLSNRSAQIIEHGWLELEAQIVDPTLPHLKKIAPELHYFPVQRLSLKQLKAAVEEAQEDYPDDPPLPVYGTQPYEYYGDVMLGGKEYLDAHQSAVAKSQELSSSTE